MPKTNPSRLVFMRIPPAVTNILLDIQPSFREYMNPDRALVVELDRALYGCIESALLWFKELTTFLATLRLVPNPHDLCVMNRDDAEGQLTVGIYVDDIVMTCKRRETSDELIRALEVKYKQLKVHRGLTHNYLGMVLDFSTPGLVRIEQSGMILEITRTAGLDELQKAHGIKETCVKTPAADYLFSTSTSLPVLSDAEGELIHSVTAKILFIANRGRPDLLTFISFMTKRVLSPTAEDHRVP